MFKLTVLIVCMAIIGSAFSLSEVKQEVVDSRAQDIAKWAVSRFVDFKDLNQGLFFQSVSNVKTTTLADSKGIQFDMNIKVGDASQRV